MSLKRALNALSNRLFYMLKGKSIFSKRCVIAGPWPKLRNSGIMKIGHGCIFRGGRVRHSLTALKGAFLQIGNNAFINDGANICAAISIQIGNNVKIGDMVCIFDTDFHAVAPDRGTKQRPIIIGHNVWVGANAMILAGTEIGDHSVIGAGSIVTGKIPCCSVAAGNPARVVRTFEVPEGWERG